VRGSAADAWAEGTKRRRRAIAAESAGQTQRAQAVEQCFLAAQGGFLVRGPYDEELRVDGEAGDSLQAGLFGHQFR